jgi:adenosylcobinamide kinase/adenosylcobinamide-phosphate guanylyltransferase
VNLTLVTGGARSGKSRFAETLAAGSGLPVVYLATMELLDDEVRERANRHRLRRPADWQTVEEPLDVVAALGRVDKDAFVLLDCITLWITNLLVRRIDDFDAAAPADWERAITECLDEAARLVGCQALRGGPLVVVTNEVGLGVVPETRAGRYFRDAAGLVNQELSRSADRVVLMVSGRPLDLPAGSGAPS